jgi:hypothetical protein
MVAATLMPEQVHWPGAGEPGKKWNQSGFFENQA